MLRKRILACLLVFVLLFLTACGGSSKNKKCDDMVVFGDTESEDPLRICVDLQISRTRDQATIELLWNDFLYQLENTVGLKDVVIECIPLTSSDEMMRGDISARMAAINRLRAEIMAGEGPDVFLMTYKSYGDMMGPDYDKTNCLFKYPEKAMENGVFLPLDKYIENNTELTEWDKLTQPVLEAGKNDEGQQIIPLNYKFPLLCLPKSDWEHIPDKKYTWNDMLTNPELMPYSLDLANCAKTINYIGNAAAGTLGSTEFSDMPYYIFSIMGEFADYEKEELKFTEKELLTCVHEVLSLEQVDGYEALNDAKEVNVGLDLSDRSLNKSMTFLPIYSVDGGVTVCIEKYAAVNRNTDRPEDAFKVIDLLMSKYVQQWSELYCSLICTYDTIPMHEDLFSESEPIVGNNYYMRADNFDAFCKVREQITGANFASEGLSILSNMMSNCRQAEYFGTTVEWIVHETYEDLQRRIRE